MKSIKTRLILLIVGALFLVSVLFGIVSYTQARGILLRQMDSSVIQLTGQISDVILANMKINISFMETLAERRIIDDNTPWEEKVAALDKEAKRAGFEIFAIADTKGNSIRFNMEKSPAQISDRDYYIRAMKGIPTYSSVFISRVTGKPSVAVAVPIKRNGIITGVLYGLRDGNEISGLVEKISIGQTGYVYVINRDGVIQGHRNHKLVLESYNPIKAAAEDKTLEPLANVLKKAIAGESGIATYYFGGRDIFGSYTPVPETDGWSVIVGMELQEILKDVNYLRNIIIFITLALVILGGILAYFIGMSIANPIIATVAYSEKMAELDLSENVDAAYTARNDEIGTLAKSFQLLIGILRTTVVEIIKASQQVAATTEQIGRDNQNLSQRTSEQASALEEIAAAIEEANAATKQNSENAGEASRLADNSLTLATDGGRVVEDAVRSIGEINDSSAKIADIITMINDIAFQTNLLALNAAVEAARAGEQGRGFAVVAGEVRNLAQRAGSAAKEIDALIKDSVGKITAGTDLVHKSGGALKEIIQSVQKAGMLVSEMAASSEEQRGGIEQINTAIMDMDTMTQQNAALVEETAAASEEMAGQAQELLSLIRRFNVGDEDKILSSGSTAGPAKKKKETAPAGTAAKNLPKEQIRDETPAEKSKPEKPGKKTKEDLLSEEGYEKF